MLFEAVEGLTLQKTQLRHGWRIIVISLQRILKFRHLEIATKMVQYKKSYSIYVGLFLFSQIQINFCGKYNTFTSFLQSISEAICMPVLNYCTRTPDNYLLLNDGQRKLQEICLSKPA